MKNQSSKVPGHSPIGSGAPGNNDTVSAEASLVSKARMPDYDDAGCESSALPNESSYQDMPICHLGSLDQSCSRTAASEEPANSMKIQTLLVEPNTLLREGLKRILFETPYRPVASVASYDEVVSVQLSGNSVVILIMDTSCDPEGAYWQIQRFKEDSPSARVVTLVEKYDREQVLAAFQAGADACLMKSMSCEAFIKSLDLVVLGEAILPVSALGLYNQDTPIKQDIEHRIRGLSARETRILQCLMDGDSNKIIARKLDITEATVKVHMKTILRKTRLKNRTQAAMWAATQMLAAKRLSAH